MTAIKQERRVKDVVEGMCVIVLGARVSGIGMILLLLRRRGKAERERVMVIAY